MTGREFLRVVETTAEQINAARFAPEAVRELVDDVHAGRLDLDVLRMIAAVEAATAAREALRILEVAS